MKPVRILMAFFAMLVISTATYAQTGRTRIQERRIAQGSRSGEITRHERRQLERQQRRIRHERRIAGADGTVTRRERREIRRHERRANRNIIRKKHNRRETI